MGCLDLGVLSVVLLALVWTLKWLSGYLRLGFVRSYRNIAM